MEYRQCCNVPCFAVCASHKVLPRWKGNIPGCASTTFLGCVDDVGRLVQQPGSGQWRAVLDIHTSTHTVHGGKKGGGDEKNDCRKGILSPPLTVGLLPTS